MLDYEGLRELLLQELHATPQAGHGSILKTYKAMGTLFFWPGLKHDVQRMVEQCELCQTMKYVPTHPQGLLQPLLIPMRRWSDITMDFIM